MDVCEIWSNGKVHSIWATKQKTFAYRERPLLIFRQNYTGFFFLGTRSYKKKKKTDNFTNSNLMLLKHLLRDSYY